MAEAHDGASALALATATPADVLVLDLSMPGSNGFELIRRLRRDAPALRILVSSMHAEQRYAIQALRAGASGYLTKERAGSELAAAVESVAGGGVYVGLAISECMAGRLDEPLDALPHERLSNREAQIFRLIVDGLTVSRIAEALGVSPKTVSTHRTRILEKMELPHDAALIRYALHYGLFDEIGG
ncbi:DNA-binding response regulator [Trinickia caryophylli]|nr:DNA-binding response regulator [Trinickia caryophylli]